MHFGSLDMLIIRVTIHSVGKVMPNQVTLWFALEASVIMYRRLAWFIVIKDATGLWVFDLIWVHYYFSC